MINVEAVLEKSKALCEQDARARRAHLAEEAWKIMLANRHVWSDLVNPCRDFAQIAVYAADELIAELNRAQARKEAV